jgi:hypothetical protein
MKKRNPKEIVYSINISDLQEVSEEVLERRLTEKEIASIEQTLGDYIDWFQAIDNAIQETIRVSL